MKSSLILRLLPLLISFVLFIIGCEKESGLPVDGDGNVYDTVVIGTQVWLKENLKTTKTNNGVPIPLVTDNDKWASLTTPAYCWYNNNPVYKENYGALYNWYAVRTNICPIGWHVPSKEEWETLINYLGGIEIADCKLRDSKFWQYEKSNPPICNNIFNESGFTARPGGYRTVYGKFGQIGYVGVWSTSVYRDGLKEYYWIISIYWFGQMELEVSSGSGTDARFGISVRCVKDN